jgi:hypothetical protein
LVPSSCGLYGTAERRGGGGGSGGESDSVVGRRFFTDNRVDSTESACSTDAETVAAQGRLISRRAFTWIATLCLGLGLALFFGHPWLPRAGVQKLDRFAREHLLANFEPVRNVESLFGGAVTILFLACSGVTVAFYAAQSNVVHAQAIVPLQYAGGSSAWMHTGVVGIEIIANSSLPAATRGTEYAGGGASLVGGCRLSKVDAAVWTVESVGTYACRYRSLHTRIAFTGGPERQQPTLHDIPFHFQHFETTLFIPTAARPRCPFDAVRYTLRRGNSELLMAGRHELRFVLLPHVRRLGGAPETTGFLVNFKAVLANPVTSRIEFTDGHDTTQLVITLERDIFAVVETTETKLEPAQLAGVIFSAVNTLYLVAIFIFKLVERPGNRLFSRLFSNYPGGSDDGAVAEVVASTAVTAGAAEASFARSNPMHAAAAGTTAVPDAADLLRRLSALEARVGGQSQVQRQQSPSLVKERDRYF